ncbi:hypothetical protein BBP40_000145 [Aspergillus hancockii]|nr:hypothetical protein BBP40_000145 [Aspergillus hancockii]
MAFVREGPVVSQGHGFVQTASANPLWAAGRRPQDTHRGSNPRIERCESSKPRAVFSKMPRRGIRPTVNGIKNNQMQQQPRQPRVPKQNQPKQFNQRRSRRGTKGKGPQHGKTNPSPRHPGRRPDFTRDGDHIMHDSHALNKQPVRPRGISVPKDVAMLDAFTSMHHHHQQQQQPPPLEPMFAALSMAAGPISIHQGIEEPQDAEMTEAPPLFY